MGLAAIVYSIHISDRGHGRDRGDHRFARWAIPTQKYLRSDNRHLHQFHNG